MNYFLLVTISGIGSNATISAIEGNINITIPEIGGADGNVMDSEINGNVSITVLELDDNLNAKAPEMGTTWNITASEIGENLNITDPNKDTNLNISMPVIGANVGIPASENIGLNVGLRDESPVNQPKPISNHHQYWNGVKDSILSGNCIGSNVCNGLGSGVKNRKGSKPPHTDKYATNQHGPPALPINVSFDPSDYFNNYYDKPIRKQSSNKEENIKTAITTEKPDSMKNEIPNLIQYIHQPNAYVNTAPNFFGQYFGAVPYQYPTSHISSDSFITNNLGFSYSEIEAPQYPNGYSYNSPQSYYYADYYPQNIQPNNNQRYYPSFRYQ